MTIESTLERIAVALETLAAAGGTVTASSSAESPASPSSEKPSTSTKSGRTSKRSSTKSSTKGDGGAEATTKSAGEGSEETSSSFSLGDVRKALTELQKAKSPAEAKALLQEFNATTLSKLEESDYGMLIARAEEMASA